MKKQKQIDLQVETIGKPSIEALPATEQRAFFEMLLESIKSLKAEDDKKKAEANNEESAD